MNIWMIEVFIVDTIRPDGKGGRWTPMYHPCFSLDEAEIKIRNKRKMLGDVFRLRIGKYVREETFE